MRRFLLGYSSVLLLALFHFPSFGQTPCDCIGNGLCPLPISDNDTTRVPLMIDLPGAPTLENCPLESVCFTIEHTWIGDLQISLESPNGERYLIMADVNNGFGGCGMQEDNVDVCIVLGTGNPLTNNTEYICASSSPCPLGTCCLSGNWTMPCGGVTDPEFGAEQAPNCDLNDFNLPGAPANGEWTLWVADICSSDTGLLHNFTLNFACPTNTSSCLADGGLLIGSSSEFCVGSPELEMDVSAQWCGGFVPDTALFDYVWTVASSDTILGFYTEPDLTDLQSGAYQVWGFSFQKTAQDQLAAFEGTSFQTALDLFELGSPPFCGDFSGNSITVTITDGGPDCSSVDVSAGADFPFPCQDATVLNGTSSYSDANPCGVLQWEMPDGTVSQGQDLVITSDDPLGTYIFSYENSYHNCVVSDSVKVFPSPGPLTLAGQDTVLACWSESYLLDGQGSAVGDNILYYWFDESGNLVSDQLQAVVNESGTYRLSLWDSLTNCWGSDEVTVTIPSPLISYIATNPADCDADNGLASVVLQSGITNAVYAWSNGATEQFASGLGQGWYSVTVSDEYCSYHQNFFVDEDLSCKVVIKGRVLNDEADEDCQEDPATVGVECIMLHLLPADIYTYSMPDGSYEFVVDDGDYVIEYIVEDQYDLLCPSPGSISVSLPTNGTVSEGNDFFVKKAPIPNLCINMYFSPARPGFEQSNYFYFCNIGNEPTDAVITLIHDPLLVPVNLATIAHDYDPTTNTATWMFEDIPPGTCQTIHYKMYLPDTVALGTPLNGIITIEPSANDIYPANNVDDWTQVVVGSYDPNEKSSLTGENQWGGIISEEDTILTYQVLFQNTGTDTAFTVVIRDTLDPNLNVETIRPGLSSHDYLLQFEGNNVLVFNFQDIMLPDSNINEPASNGFVTFTIQRNEGLEIGTEFNNSAAIYFDYNSPIITNTITHILERQIVHTYQSVTLCNGGVWNGQVYDADTLLVSTFVFPIYDSIVHTSIEVLPVIASQFSVEICENSTYLFDGQTLSQSGEYTAVFPAANGCDSTVTLNLSLLNTLENSVEAEICDGEIYLFGNEEIALPGVYQQTFLTIDGCDSIVALQLSVLPTAQTEIQASICPGEIFMFNGEALDVPGTYNATFPAANGCDSTVFLVLDILPEYETSFSAEICEGETFPFGALMLAQSGDYQQVFTASNGCDSTVSLQLEVKPVFSTEQDLEIEFGGSWNGIPVYSDTTIIEILQAANGCDSIVTTNLSVLTSTRSRPGHYFEMTVSPNPFDATFSIEIKGLESGKPLTVKLLDVTGRLIAEHLTRSSKVTFERGRIPSGLYFIKVEEGNRLVAVGRVVAR